LGLECQIKVDFVDYLKFTTIFPLLVVATIFCCAVIHGIFIKYRFHPVFREVANVSDRLRQMRATYSYLLFVWLYLTLPGTSTVIFSMLNVPYDADPNNALNGSYDRYYLSADLSISCASERYEYGVRWAYVMLFVYPVVS
jgi:hypothetical protein